MLSPFVVIAAATNAAIAMYRITNTSILVSPCKCDGKVSGVRFKSYTLCHKASGNLYQFLQCFTSDSHILYLDESFNGVLIIESNRLYTSIPVFTVLIPTIHQTFNCTLAQGAMLWHRVTGKARRRH